MKAEFSDEMINAFVDGELDSRDRETFKQAMRSDNHLYEKVQAICELKKSLKNSYAQLPAASNSVQVQNGGVRVTGWKQSVAAALLLTLGLVVGWVGGSGGLQPHSSVQLDGIQLNPVDLQQQNKIVLHISSSEGNKLEQTIQKVEYIIHQFEKRHLPFELEVIANSGGIDLLRTDVSPYKDKIISIMDQYSNVSFIACSNAINRLRMQGVEPKIIAHSKTGDTAVERIVKRLQEGWVYVKV